MNINIYGKYKVNYTCKGSDIDSENSEPNDIVFKDLNFQKEEVLDGGILINQISYYLRDNYFSELIVDHNTIIIKHFNYNTGEYNTNTWVIEEIN